MGTPRIRLSEEEYTSIMTKRESEVSSALVIPDIHYPFHDPKTVGIAIQLAKDIKPDKIILLGDCFDAKNLSKKFKDPNLTMEQGVYLTRKEMLGFREEVFLPLWKAGGECEVLWCGGNHDLTRTEEAIRDEPDRGELIDTRKMFPEAKICSYGEYHKVGKLLFTHGDYCNDAHAKKHVLMYGSPVIYGHTHTFQTYTSIAKSDSKPHMAISLGCACKKDPEYIKNKANAWVHAVGVCYFFKSGEFNFYPVQVINGRTIFNGIIYS